MLPKKVILNVHGKLYETLESTLQRYPSTLLAAESRRRVPLQRSPVKRDGDVIVISCRTTAAFDAILFYYQSYGILRRPPEVPMDEFVHDCRRFEIQETDIERMQELEGFLYEGKSTAKETGCRAKQELWRFLEYPESSNRASLFAVISCLIIAASTCLACVQTLPAINAINSIEFSSNPFLLAELAFNTFFAMEYLLRFVSSPHKCAFMKSASNTVDLVAVFPYFAALAIDIQSISKWKFLRIVRTVRILRLLRLTRQSKTLDIAVRIISNCASDLLTMALTIFISCLFCGTLEYYAEFDVPGSQFTSLPQAIWWAAQTVIPLGYGDIVPISTRGKVIGGCIVSLSALTFTLPLLFLGGKFLKYYSKNFGITIQTDCKRESTDQKSSKK
eukprot:gene500-1147_t